MSGSYLAAIRDGASTAPRRLDRSDVDFLHGHHGVERALRFVAAGRQRACQYPWSDLPGNPPPVLAPTARALLADIAADGIPVGVGLLLIVRGGLEQEGFGVLEIGNPVQAETRDARDGEFDRQHVALFAGWVVAGCAVHGTHRAVGKGLGVEAGGSLGVLVVPEANRILRHGVYLSL